MKLFVWDFHGVLEKGNEAAVIEISNAVLEEFGYSERFTPEENESLYGRKWYEYFEYLLPTEPHERHLQLQAASFKMSDERWDIVTKHIKPTANAIGVLEAIASSHQQIVVSNTKPHALVEYIRTVGMTDYFNHTNAFAVDQHKRDAARTKQDVLREYLESNPQVQQLVIIGDSKSDMALVEVAGGTRYLYAHPHRAFKDAESDYQTHDLRDILREVHEPQMAIQ
jgi:phosphoglycolate phosphatase-like HAD superfamily hydrolase